LRTAKQKFEKLFIQKKLREYNGDVKKVAEVIGIDLSNLYRKLKLYGIEV
jgi:DNA-binding NtrC family response regulator